MHRSEKARWHMRKRGTVSLERLPVAAQTDTLRISETEFRPVDAGRCTFLPNRTRRTAAFPNNANTDTIQISTRRKLGDMMSSQGLKSSWVGVQVMELELVQYSW